MTWKEHNPCNSPVDSHFYKYVLPVVVTEFALWAYAFMSDARTCQVILGLVGLWWCLAALWVEIMLDYVYPHFDYEKTPVEVGKYKPFCHFAPWANCSFVLMSPSGRFLRFFGIALDHTKTHDDSWLSTVRGWIDVPNPTLGTLFFTFHLFYNVLVDIVYGFMWLSSLFDFADWLLPWAFFVACCGVGCMAVWLAYKLFFVLQDFCVVCVSMYVVIFALVPVMHRVCMTDSSLMRGFGAVPTHILYPFLLIDGCMLFAVLGLYYRKVTKARTLADNNYLLLA